MNCRRTEAAKGGLFENNVNDDNIKKKNIKNIGIVIFLIVAIINILSIYIGKITPLLEAGRIATDFSNCHLISSSRTYMSPKRTSNSLLY